jgi:hypothetical protein
MAAKIHINYYIVRTGIFDYILECEDLDMKIRGTSAKEVTAEFYDAIRRYFDGVASVGTIKRQKKDGQHWMMVALT